MVRPEPWQSYDPAVALPLGGYLVLVGAFMAIVAAGFVVLKRRGFFAPVAAEGETHDIDDGKSFLTNIKWRDVALLAVATHQLSWMIGRDRVLAPFRALFAHYESSGGAGELNDGPRGGGLVHAIGDLVTCPYCLGPWVAVALIFAYLKTPRATRLVAIILTLVAASDMLHQLYTLMKHASGG
jgi:hypothetical protein